MRRKGPSSTTALYAKRPPDTKPWRLWFRKPNASQYTGAGEYDDRRAMLAVASELQLQGFEVKPEYRGNSIYTPRQNETLINDR